MRKIAADQFAALSAPQLRYAEAEHLFDLFKTARNAEPNHGLFLLTTYFDSLLFCFVSIEEMVDQPTREALRRIPSFLFFKALRNIATHHSILSGVQGKFPRPIARIVSVAVGGRVDFSEQFFLMPEKLREIFSLVLKERPGEKRTIDIANEYLSSLESSGSQIMVVDLVERALADIESLVA